MLALTLAATSYAPPAGLSEWKDAISWTDVRLARPALNNEAIAKINAPESKSTWVAGRNAHFENATLADVKKLCGVLQSKSASDILPYRPLAQVAIPDEFDWRTDSRAASCPSVSEIRDQANCGSCWAFGSVEAMSDRICIASGGATKSHLSAQDVASCDKLGDMGCNGGVPSTVYTYYATSGIVTGGNYGDKSMCWSYQLAPCAHHTDSSKYPACPDSVRMPSCARSCEDNSQIDWKSDKVKGSAGYSVCQQGIGNDCPTSMMQEIYQNGPITAQFFVHESFTSYKSGVYESNGITDPMLGGHAIKIIGYGTEDGTPYWLVANSWNEDWGMDGYFKIVRGKNEGQIENAVINGGPVAGMPK